MSIDSQTVARIAHLARLNIPAEEQQHVAGELNKILDWVEQLNTVDVTGIEPLANVNDKALRTRADVVNDGVDEGVASCVGDAEAVGLGVSVCV